MQRKENNIVIESKTQKEPDDNLQKVPLKHEVAESETQIKPSKQPKYLPSLSVSQDLSLLCREFELCPEVYRTTSTFCTLI